MNELATTAELAEVNAIFADQGQNVEEVIKIPFLKVQYDSALFMKNPNCRMGMYSISGPHPIYSETVKMRVLLAHIQWRQQNSEDFKMVNKSILMDNRGQEPIDMLGGVRCGRPDPDLWKDMSDAIISDSTKLKKMGLFNMMNLKIIFLFNLWPEGDIY